MTKTFAERCHIAQQCLPDAQYKALLTNLHAEMLAALAEQPALVVPVQQETSDLKHLAAICPELNMSNYTSDDVDELNHWAIEVATAIDELAEQPAPAAQQEPLTLQELEAAWNAQADHMNTWDELGLDEIVAWAQAAHVIKENT